MASNKQYSYLKKYRDKSLKRITCDVQRTTYDKWKAFADEQETPITTLIKLAVEQYIESFGGSDV